MRRAFFFTALICASTLSPVHAKQRSDGTTNALPVSDGAYLLDANRCQMLKAGELDMVDLTVENDGRSFGYPEVGCVVTSVKKISSSRYAVKGDCREFGELSQTDFFLDVFSQGRLRIEGEKYAACDWKPPEAPTVSNTIPVLSPRKRLLDVVPLPIRDSFVESEPTEPLAIRKLIDQWGEEEEGCRGGSGDDPKTDKACGRREKVVEKLRQAGWCYGENEQSLAEQDWRVCN